MPAWARVALIRSPTESGVNPNTESSLAASDSARSLRGSRMDLAEPFFTNRVSGLLLS